MRNFLVIAITGGIGSGKSTVSDIIRSFGYVVYDADRLFGELLSDEKFVSDIYDFLAEKPYYSDNRIVYDREKISAVVFSDRDKLARLNDFTHERVFAEINEIINKHISAAPLFFEIPLLFESGSDKSFDNVIVVKRPLTDRIESVRERSGLSGDEILSRIQNQIDYDKTDFNEHTLIINNSDVSDLKVKVKNALDKILQNK